MQSNQKPIISKITVQGNLHGDFYAQRTTKAELHMGCVYRHCETHVSFASIISEITTLHSSLSGLHQPEGQIPRKINQIRLESIQNIFQNNRADGSISIFPLPLIIQNFYFVQLNISCCCHQKISVGGQDRCNFT